MRQLALAAIAAMLTGCGTASTPATSSKPATDSAVPTKMHPTVAKLLSASERDEAYREILSWQKYRGTPAYRETEAKPVKCVIECPQPEGTPLLAVFLKSSFDHPGLTTGHIVIIDGDGTIIPFDRGANYLQGEFDDFNDDGIIEVVEQEWMEAEETSLSAAVVRVIPVTREMKVNLAVAYARNGINGGGTENEYEWRNLLDAKHRRLMRLLIFASGRPTSPLASYSWDTERRQWIGNRGGGDQPFFRIDDLPEGALKAFVKKEPFELTMKKRTPTATSKPASNQ